MKTLLVIVCVLSGWSASAVDAVDFVPFQQARLIVQNNMQVHATDPGFLVIQVDAARTSYIPYGQRLEMPLDQTNQTVVCYSGYGGPTANNTLISSITRGSNYNHSLEITSHGGPGAHNLTYEERLAPSYWFWFGFYTGFLMMGFAITVRFIRELLAPPLEMTL